MTINWILEAVSDIRQQSEIPIALMGYINPILRYGLIKFMQTCSEVGVDGPISAPDSVPAAGTNVVTDGKFPRAA